MKKLSDCQRLTTTARRVTLGSACLLPVMISPVVFEYRLMTEPMNPSRTDLLAP